MNNDLAQLEQFAEAIFGGSSKQEERVQAAAALKHISEPQSPEGLGQAQLILEHSRNDYALLLAVNGMTYFVDKKWNSLPIPGRLELRNYLLQYIATRGSGLQDFALKALIKVVCLIVKLSWFDSNDHSEVIQQLSKFVTASIEYCILGLRIFAQLVNDMNQRKAGGFTLAGHRKVAISFRDTFLLEIFKLSLKTLTELLSKQVQLTEQIEDKLKNYALTLAHECLSFDFIGTSPDESATDTGTVHMPSTWCPLFQDQNTIALFMQLYLNSQPPRSSQTMQCMVQIASIRRSLFSTEEERAKFLELLLQFQIAVMKTQAGLQDKDNHHELCRMLTRLKANYQLAHLVVCQGYAEWIALLMNFTCQTFKAWSWAPNSMHYLMALWARLASSTAYLTNDIPDRMAELTPQLFESYLESRLDAGRYYHGSGSDDPLDDPERLLEQLETLPPIGRANYNAVYAAIIRQFDPLATTYEQNPKNGSNMSQMVVVEAQLAWLVYIIGAVVGGRLITNTTEEHDAIDGELAVRVFMLLSVSNSRLAQGIITEQSSGPQLESAFIFFISQFRNMYITEQASSALVRIYHILAERAGIQDHIHVMHVVVNKIMLNLRVWAQSEAVITKTLKLFEDLSSGYGSSKLLAKMDAIPVMLENHTSSCYPFLEDATHARNRTAYYTTMSRLLFMESYIVHFDRFMLPFHERIRQLIQAAAQLDTFRTENVKWMIIGLLRDLTGIATSINSRSIYCMMFDWLYPDLMPIFQYIAQAWADTPTITTPLLKFFSEFTFNKNGRISFKSSSPNGILLFREASKLLVAYTRTAQGYFPVSPEDKHIYAKLYRGVWLSMAILSRCLGGNYVNFGVFALYGDPALTDALRAVLSLALHIDFNEMMRYPKMVHQYITLLNVLCQNHTPTVIDMETPIFIRIVLSLKEALFQLFTENSITSYCCDAFDAIFSFIVESQHKDSPTIQQFKRHFTEHPEVASSLLDMLWNLLLFEESSSLWALGRPLLSLIVLFPDNFVAFKNRLCASQPVDKQGRLAELFENLMREVKDNVMSKNRDRFTQNLALFVSDAKTFIVH